MTHIAFVGPQPPPVNGFSTVCAMMLDLLKCRARVHVFNRTPRSGKRVSTLLRQIIIQPLHFVNACVSHRNLVVYLALSGGLGQLYDMLYVIIAKAFGRRVFVHHHSFSYINSTNSIYRFCFIILRRATHIVLSPEMGIRLAKVYGLDQADIRVVSNAAFYDLQESGGLPGDVNLGPLRIGFLSNITFEKGFVEFFAILQQLKAQGVGYRAALAGPIDAAARATFDALLGAAADVEYLGPLYGDAKDRFYRELDIFVFPTNYANEAEPLVIFEALRNGVHVIACERGAIAELLSNGAGLAFPREQVVAAAVMNIARFSGDRSALAEAQRLSLQQAQRMRSSGKAALDSLLHCMHAEGSAQDSTGLA